MSRTNQLLSQYNNKNKEQPNKFLFYFRVRLVEKRGNASGLICLFSGHGSDFKTRQSVGFVILGNPGWAQGSIWHVYPKEQLAQDWARPQTPLSAIVNCHLAVIKHGLTVLNNDDICPISETAMPDQLTNGHPAAEYYFWCMNPQCNLNGGTYPDVMFPALKERMRECDRLCDVRDLLTWTRQEEADIRRDEFTARHTWRIWRREEREDYRCEQCFVPDCELAISLALGRTCICDVCSCR